MHACEFGSEQPAVAARFTCKLQSSVQEGCFERLTLPADQIDFSICQSHRVSNSQVSTLNSALIINAKKIHKSAMLERMFQPISCGCCTIFVFGLLRVLQPLPPALNRLPTPESPDSEFEPGPLAGQIQCCRLL